MFTRRYKHNQCWICGSTAEPSAEHKIKASDIRRQFGKIDKGGLLIGRNDGDGYRIAQGPKANAFKYKGVICSQCNSARTQESDKAYDLFINNAEEHHKNSSRADLVFSEAQFQPGGINYIPLFRYFAKRIGCHLAEANAPIPVHLSRFVAKKNSKNCIWLDIKDDVEYERLFQLMPDEPLQYAAHGGLVVITKLPKLLPSRVHTTLTIGPIQFIIYYVYTVFELWDMRLRFPDFIRNCADTAKRAEDNPISDEDLRRLGLID